MHHGVLEQTKNDNKIFFWSSSCSGQSFKGGENEEVSCCTQVQCSCNNHICPRLREILKLWSWSTNNSIISRREGDCGDCAVLQDIGFGLTKELVGIVIRDYLKYQPAHPNPFHLGIPEWLVEAVLEAVEMWPQYSETTTSSNKQSTATTPEVITACFVWVESVISKIGLAEMPPEELQDYLWNCDETGFVLHKHVARFLLEGVTRMCRKLLVVVAGNILQCWLQGLLAVKFFHHTLSTKRKTSGLSGCMQGGPDGSHYTVSDSGWMEAAYFLQWFKKMFVPAVKNLTTKAPVVLIFDGHHSHISIELIELAQRNRIHLLCLPPHSTHLLQPLDIAVFGPMKAAWKRLLKENQIATCAANVTKEDFPGLVAKLWE